MLGTAALSLVPFGIHSDQLCGPKGIQIIKMINILSFSNVQFLVCVYDCEGFHVFFKLSSPKEKAEKRENSVT